MDENIEGEEGIIRSVCGGIIGGAAGLASAVGFGIGLDFIVQYISPETPEKLRLAFDILGGIALAPWLAKGGSAVGEYVFHYARPVVATKKIGRLCKNIGAGIENKVKQYFLRERED